MSQNLDALNAQVTALTAVVAEVVTLVNGNPAKVELDATNAGVDAVTAQLATVVTSLNALVTPAPVVTPSV